MSNISMVEAKLPPGFRFHPRDEELVCDYLMKKISSSNSFFFIEVDLNKCEPWDLPETACVGGKEWYFYSQRDRKYATGLRTNRATASGYWKATGKDRPILRNKAGGGSHQQLVGMRKTLVFYQGRAPKGRKTDWVMHEFRVEGTLSPPRRSAASHKEDWVLCRVFFKNRDENTGPKQSIGIVTRNNTNTISYDDEDDDYLDTDNNNSSSLPPLMDSSYNINFDQQQTAHDDQYEQVPCFSMFSSHDPPPSSNSLFPQFFCNNSAAANSMEFAADHQQVLSVVPPPAVVVEEGTFSTCDKKVIKAVLSHLTKVENATDNISSYPYYDHHVVKDSSCLSLGEGSSVESYLSDVGIPNLWNSY